MLNYQRVTQTIILYHLESGAIIIYQYPIR